MNYKLSLCFLLSTTSLVYGINSDSEEDPDAPVTGRIIVVKEEPQTPLQIQEVEAERPPFTPIYQTPQQPPMTPVPQSPMGDPRFGVRFFGAPQTPVYQSPMPPPMTPQVFDLTSDDNSDFGGGFDENPVYAQHVNNPVHRIPQAFMNNSRTIHMVQPVPNQNSSLMQPPRLARANVPASSFNPNNNPLSKDEERFVLLNDALKRFSLSGGKNKELNNNIANIIKDLPENNDHQKIKKIEQFFKFIDIVHKGDDLRRYKELYTKILSITLSLENEYKKEEYFGNICKKNTYDISKHIFDHIMSWPENNDEDTFSKIKQLISYFSHAKEDPLCSSQYFNNVIESILNLVDQISLENNSKKNKILQILEDSMEFVAYDNTVNALHERIINKICTTIEIIEFEGDTERRKYEKISRYIQFIKLNNKVYPPIILQNLMNVIQSLKSKESQIENYLMFGVLMQQKENVETILNYIENLPQKFDDDLDKKINYLSRLHDLLENTSHCESYANRIMKQLFVFYKSYHQNTSGEKLYKINKMLELECIIRKWYANPNELLTCVKDIINFIIDSSGNCFNDNQLYNISQLCLSKGFIDSAIKVLNKISVINNNFKYHVESVLRKLNQNSSVREREDLERLRQKYAPQRMQPPAAPFHPQASSSTPIRRDISQNQPPITGNFFQNQGNIQFYPPTPLSSQIPTTPVHINEVQGSQHQRNMQNMFMNRSQHLHRQIVEQGHADAQYNLGVCYENGWGVEQNLALAVEWYKQAAEQGNPQAKEALERLKMQLQPSQDADRNKRAREDDAHESEAKRQKK